MVRRIPLEKDRSSSNVNLLEDTLCQPSLLAHDIVRRVRKIDGNDLVRADHGSLATFGQPELVHIHRRQGVACLHGSDDAIISVDDEAYAEEVAFLLVTNDHAQVVRAVVVADVEILSGVRAGDSIAVPDQVAELVVDVWARCVGLVRGHEDVAVGETILDGHVECWCS